jgi:PAS domain S-box-containing protein
VRAQPPGKSFTGKIASSARWVFEGEKIPLKITFLFLVVGLSWFMVLDEFMDVPEKIRDAIFLVSAAWLLYWLIDHGVKAIQRSQEALKESQKRLGDILETSPCGILLFDKEGAVAYANLATSILLGGKRSELIGKHFKEIGWEIATAEGNSFPGGHLAAGEVLQEGRSIYDMECTVRTPHRDRVNLSFNSAPLFDEAGKIAGMVVAFLDITERKRAQELMLRKLSLAVEQSPIAIMITDTQSRIEYVNPSYTVITGYPPEEVIDTKTTTACGQSPELCRRVCEHVCIRGEWKEVLRNVRKNGEQYWEEVSVTPIRDSEGKITHYLWIRADITEHRNAVEALKESEERFRELFEQTVEPILLFASGTTRILDANAAAVAVYGYSREELVEKGSSLFVDPADAKDFGKCIEGIQENRSLSLNKVYHRRKDGARIIVSIRGKSIHLKGAPVSYCSFRDITDRVRMEEETKIQQAKLIHANRMAALGTIVSGVAHEVSNPNNLIMFNAPLLLAAWEDALPILLRYYQENGEYLIGGLPFTEMRTIASRLLMDISDSSHRIKGIVGRLKEFSRAGDRRLDGTVDLNEVVRKSIGILHNEIAKKTRNFHVDYGTGLPMVRGWAMELEQVVVNLIDNSLQALPDPVRGVWVSTSMDGVGESVEIRVGDEGVGMTPETLARLTEPFFSTKLDSGGLGLGLSISNTIVQEHKGTLTFESEVGKGTIARISLPAAAEEGKGHQKGIRARELQS